MQSKKMQLARALVFTTTISGILVGNLAMGYWLGTLLVEHGLFAAYGKVIGIVLGMTSAVWGIYWTIKRDFIGSVHERFRHTKERNRQQDEE